MSDSRVPYIPDIQRPPKSDILVEQFIHKVTRNLSIKDSIQVFYLLSEIAWSRINELPKYEAVLNKYPNMALELALVAHSTPETFNYILAHGADPNLEYYDYHLGKCTPLIFAAFYKNKELIELLLLYGADINKTTDDLYYWSPLRTSFYNVNNDHNFEIAKYLLQQGADINIKNRWNQKLVFTFANNPEVLHFLISNGANINAKNLEGDSLLHIAIKNNRPDVVSLLLSLGINLNLKNKDSETAYDLAKRTNNEIFQIIDTYVGHLWTNVLSRKTHGTGNVFEKYLKYSSKRRKKNKRNFKSKKKNKYY
jgi:ankyrin repeat protein